MGRLCICSLFVEIVPLFRQIPCIPLWIQMFPCFLKLNSGYNTLFCNNSTDTLRMRRNNILGKAAEVDKRKFHGNNEVDKFVF